jgi:hypothetical protein
MRERKSGDDLVSETVSGDIGSLESRSAAKMIGSQMPVVSSQLIGRDGPCDATRKKICAIHCTERTRVSPNTTISPAHRTFILLKTHGRKMNSRLRTGLSEVRLLSGPPLSPKFTPQLM